MSERFVDQDESPIPPASTWGELSVNQLIDVKLRLEDKAMSFRNTPQIKLVLQQAIQRITALIAERSSQ